MNVQYVMEKGYTTEDLFILYPEMVMEGKGIKLQINAGKHVGFSVLTYDRLSSMKLAVMKLSVRYVDNDFSGIDDSKFIDNRIVEIDFHPDDPAIYSLANYIIPQLNPEKDRFLLVRKAALYDYRSPLNNFDLFSDDQLDLISEQRIALLKYLDYPDIIVCRRNWAESCYDDCYLYSKDKIRNNFLLMAGMKEPDHEYAQMFELLLKVVSLKYRIPLFDDSVSVHIPYVSSLFESELSGIILNDYVLYQLIYLYQDECKDFIKHVVIGNL